MGDLIIRGLNKKYGDKSVVSDVNFTIKEGQLYTFLGPSGCGKTTILRMIAGLVKEDSGQIILNDKDLCDVPTEKRGIAMVFQNYALFPHLNVYENIAYGLKVKRLGKEEIATEVDKYMKLIHLEGYEKRRIDELSGGEQQRVALARALITKPRLFLLDEPLSNLDAKLRLQMRKEIRDLQQELGITTIFVTHDQDEAIAISDEIAVFNQGKCMQCGKPQDIYENPSNEFVANFMGETNFMNISGQDKKLIRPEKIEIYKSKMNKENEMNAIIMKREFYGKVLEYTLKVNEIMLKAVAINREEYIFEEGQEVYISIKQKDIQNVE